MFITVIMSLLLFIALAYSFSFGVGVVLITRSSNNWFEGLLAG